MTLIKTSMGGYVWVYGPENLDQKFCRDISEAVKFGRSCLDIPHVELIHGIKDGQQNNNPVMEFGDINGLFLFSRGGKNEVG